MQNIKTLLTKDEAKKLMHTRLKPITTNGRNTSDSIFKMGAVHISCLAIVLLISLVTIFNCAQFIAEAHANIGNASLKPLVNIDQTNQISGATPAIGSIKLPTVSHYDPTENTIMKSLGSKQISVNDKSMIRYDLPNEYYEDMDFTLIHTISYYNKLASNKKFFGITNNQDERMHVDLSGFIRYKTNSDQFTINNQPDYLISKEIFPNKDINGNRYLVVTSAGMYTIITDDEKEYAHNNASKFSGLKGSDTAEKVYNFLRAKGCSHEASIGILANMNQESGIDPTSLSSDESARGIVQWMGGRFNNLVTFANQHGRNWTDLESQLEFMWIELNSKDMNHRLGGFERFKNIDSAEDATGLFERAFERSGGSAMGNRYGAIYWLDKKLKGLKSKKSGLLKWINEQGSVNISNSVLGLKPEFSESTKALQSKILCIYKID